MATSSFSIPGFVDSSLDLKNCGEPGCKNLEHSESKHNLCALHEFLWACDDLKACHMRNPPNPKFTADAHAEALIWKAHFDMEQEERNAY